MLSAASDNPGLQGCAVPTTREIIDQQLGVIDPIKRGISTSKLKSAQAVDCSDFLNGLAAALPIHPHIGHVTFECAREISAKAAIAKSIEKSNS
jgi:hypothetical protein